jgi:hypothetical protein
MAVDTTKNLQKEKSRSYLAKDFNSFKTALLSYAKNYFSSTNADFSDASVGGMFVELAAYIGDNLTFFLDHQFNELNPQTATEIRNIVALAQSAGVKTEGAAPSVVTLKIYIEVPAVLSEGSYVPMEAALPIVKTGTSCNSFRGKFTTTEDLDFSERDLNGNSMASIQTSQTDSSGNPSYFIMTRDVIAIAGEIHTQQIRITSRIPFRKVSLTRANVSQVISVRDSLGNEYYEVDYLTQNTVFKKAKNITSDALEVNSSIEILAAPRRFVRSVDYLTGLTSLQFGAGDEETLDDDIIPDPSELALPLYGRKTIQRFAIDPRNLLKTKTLGISPAGTTLTVRYRAGGGLSTNTDAETVNSFSNTLISFPKSPSAIISSNVINSLDVINEQPAIGGANAMTIEELRGSIFSARNEQSRIVSQNDLLARLYTLPPEFGRVYRAAVTKNPRNPMSTELYILCQNSLGNLTIASDSLKKNLSTYLNEFRLINDAVDILDATVINYGIEYVIVCAPGYNKEQVLANVSSQLRSTTQPRFYQIDQPLIEADFINVIINTPGVLSLQEMLIFNKSGKIGTTQYSNYPYDLEANKFKGMIVGPKGSIFEMLSPSLDIIGRSD